MQFSLRNKFNNLLANCKRKKESFIKNKYYKNNMNKKILMPIALIALLSLAVFVSAYKEEYLGVDGFGMSLVDKAEGQDSTRTLLALTYEVQGAILTGKRFGVTIEDYNELSEAKHTFNQFKGKIVEYQQNEIGEIKQNDFREIVNEHTNKIEHLWLSDSKLIRVFGYNKNDNLERNAFYFLFEQITKEYPSTLKSHDFCENVGQILAVQYCSKDLLWVDQKGKEDFCENNYECQSNICVDNMCVERGVFTKFLEWFKGLFK
jgi:hypothetical protein